MQNTVDSLWGEEDKWRDYPGGPVVKNLPYNAGDAGSIPGWGTKIPYALEQLSPRGLELRDTTREILWRMTSHDATETQHSQINIYLKK